MQSTIELDFADGFYDFALTLPQINELQTKCGIGIGGLYARVFKGAVLGENGAAVMLPHLAEFHILDIVETIRQGLIGGGRGLVNDEPVTVTPAVANRLIENYVLGKPLQPNWCIAAAILSACVHGYDPPKKAGPDAAPAKKTKTAD